MAAIYQWFDPEIGPGDFLDFDYLVIQTDHEDHCRLIGVDLLTGQYEEYGSFYAGFYQRAVATDRSVFFTPGPSLDMQMYVWRGHCFSKVYQAAVGPNNSIDDIKIIHGFDNKVMVMGTNAFGHGLRVLEYTNTPPFSFNVLYSRLPASDYWSGFSDMRFGNQDTREIGDALVCLPQNGNAITTYKNDGGILTQVDQEIGNALGPYMSWGMDRTNGYIASHFNASTTIRVYKIDPADLTITSIGACSATLNNVRAVTFSHTGFVVTVEDTGVGDTLRTYSLSGTTLTHIDSFSLGSDTNQNAKFETSPRTGRIWLLCPSNGIGFSAFSISETGMITRDYRTSEHVFYNSGSAGNKVNFLYEPPITISNGFTGIKEKLYECWEMFETGSVTREGSMGNMDLVVDITAVDSVSNALGTAAHFEDGHSALFATRTTEIEGTGSFSACIDVVIDDKDFGVNAQTIIGIHAYSIVVDYDQANWGLRYHQGRDQFEFYVADGSVDTYVAATDVGPIVEGTKYHIYFEYSTADNTVGIRVNDGTKYTAAYTTTRNTGGSHLVVGRLSESLSFRRPLYGATNKLFYFWDILDESQQDWMWNGGSTRTFSEL